MPERDESQDDHKRFIEENYDAIVRVARDGYLQHGRGAAHLHRVLHELVDEQRVSARLLGDRGGAGRDVASGPPQQHGRELARLVPHPPVLATLPYGPSVAHEPPLQRALDHLLTFRGEGSSR